MCPPMEQVHRWLLWFSLVILLKSLLTCTQHALSPIREKSMVPDETKQRLWKRLPYTLTEANFIKWFLLCLSQPDNPDMAHHINSLNFGSEIKVILRFTAVIVFVRNKKQIAVAIASLYLICMYFPTQDKLPGAFVALRGRNKEDVNSEWKRSYHNKATFSRLYLGFFSISFQKLFFPKV